MNNIAPPEYVLEMYTKEELLAELKRREDEAERAAQRVRDSVTPIWSYRVEPSPVKNFHKVFDDTIVMYTLYGTLENREEMFEAGHTSLQSDGSMSYYFNTGTGKIVTNVGGGTLYISDSSWGVRANKEAIQEAHDYAFERLGAFITNHPEGGDITDIVVEFQAARKASS